MPDFFVFSKVFPLLLNPLPLVLLTIVITSFWLKKNVIRWVIRIAALLLWLLSTPWFADQASRWWEFPRSAREQLPLVSDAAVVLGGVSDPVSSTSEHLEFGRAAERLTEAVELWREGRVKRLLITSGSGELLNPQAVEAPGLARWVRAQGVPDEAVLVEAKSRNTYENATFSLALVEQENLRSLVLVTSAVHMRRASAIFRKALAGHELTLALWPVDTQLDARRFPFNAVPDPSSLATVQAVLKEVVGYGVYWLQGYL